MKRLLAWKRVATLAVEEFEKKVRAEWKVVKHKDLLERGRFLEKSVKKYGELIKEFSKEKDEILKQVG